MLHKLPNGINNMPSRRKFLRYSSAVAGVWADVRRVSANQLGLHNEEFEMTSVNGRRTYDILLDSLDAKLVKFQFQCSTISNGFDAAEYFTKYPGRFISMHVQDWDPAKRHVTAVGKGSLDW